ncbi:MAG TPA: Fic family protein [Candidatus Acidoferrales bacterium]|nr:Fic family protein [Candidatus Acidoferrales bacterium]
MPRLLPHIAALESYREAASNRVRPPQWREESPPGDAESSPDLPAEQGPSQKQIDIRKEQLRTRNTDRARAWVKQRFVPGSAPLSLADILSMHSIVAHDSGVRYNTPGTLRHSGFIVSVGRPVVGGIHVGAPESRLPQLMDQYIQFVNGKTLVGLPAVIHALLAHFFFTTIHPLEDGNGRVSRLVAAGILFQRGYNGHGFYALSNYFYDNDIKYHRLLHYCWQQPLPFDLTPFVAFGIEGMVVELQGINSFIKMKLNRSVDKETLASARKRRSARRLPVFGIGPSRLRSVMRERA